MVGQASAPDIMMTSGDACPTIRLGLMGTRPTGALALMSQQHEVVHVVLNKLLTAFSEHKIFLHGMQHFYQHLLPRMGCFNWLIVFVAHV